MYHSNGVSFLNLYSFMQNLINCLHDSQTLDINSHSECNWNCDNLEFVVLYF